MKIDLPFDDFTEIADASAIEAEADKLEQALSTSPTDAPEQ